MPWRRRRRQHATGATLARREEGHNTSTRQTVVCRRARARATPLLLFLSWAAIVLAAPVAAAGATATAAGTGGARGASTRERESKSEYMEREDHAVVAVTVDGHVHTLDAWTGNVRGVFADSGGPLVSSSTTIDVSTTAEGSGDENGGQDRSDHGSEGGDESSSSGTRRNALGEGFVVPGLDGVIYSLDTDGRLSVLMSSAPDLVLEPRMACLAVSSDSDGIVKDESCGLLIGEKTTELFSLDTETGEATRVGGGGPTRPMFKESADSGSYSGGSHSDGKHTDWTRGDSPWNWGSNTPQRAQSRLLLQRDEYVVRALDTVTSEELWFVTVAHFSALDLEGKGGVSALTRAKVAAAGREGYSRAVRTQFGDHEIGEELMKLLPPPDDMLAGEDGESSEFWDTDALFAREGERWDDGGAGPSSGTEWGDGSGSGGGRRRPRQNIVREKFGTRHVDRFPYLLYEENAWVVAMDPIDGSVLWRREMPSLAVSLYGIRGREWVDIMPPPMSLLKGPQHPLQSPTLVGPGGTGLVTQASVDDMLSDGEVEWSRAPEEVEPLLLLTNEGGANDLFEVDQSTWDPASGLPSKDASVISDEEGGSGNDSPDDRSTSLSSEGELTDDTCPFSSAFHEEETTKAVVASTTNRRPGTSRMPGLLQPGLRHGGQMQAQVGFLNGHFFVSSSLRKSPLQAAAENSAIVAHDRYPHPVGGMASRRSFVDSAGRGSRGGGGDMGAAATEALPHIEPPVSKLPPHARPPDPDAGHGNVNGRSGASVTSGDWRQALGERVERDLQAGKSSVASEFNPDHQGLYVSWRFLGWVVGLVSVIVAVVAYMAYKYGAEAMANMSTITRKGSITVGRLSRTNSATPPAAAVNGVLALRSNLPFTSSRSSSTSGRESPLLEHPTLHHGASASSTVTGSRSWIWTNGSNKEQTSRSGGPTPAEVLRNVQRSTAVSIHRVHSLPVLGQSLSPSTPRDRRDGKGQWKSLFGHASGEGNLMRAVSANSSPEKHSGVQDEADQGGAGAGAGDSHGTGGASATIAAAAEQLCRSTVDSASPVGSPSHKTAAAENARGEAAGKPLVNSAGDEIIIVGAAGIDSPESLSDERRSVDDSSDESSRSSSSSSSSSPSSPVFSRESSRTADKGAGASRATRDHGSGSVHSSGSGRRRRHQRQLQGRDSAASSRRGHSGDRGAGRPDVDSDGWSERDRGSEHRERRTSRSPRTILAREEEEEEEHGAILLGGGSCVGGSGEVGGGADSVGVENGRDAPDALLVTNRRLRTEFVEGPKLGRGGFGAVYKCRNRLDGHDYAVKKIRLSSDRRWQQQLAKVLREVKILALLDHPNIVRYYQAWLEKFTEEDEQLLRSEKAPSLSDTNTSAAWGQSSTAGGLGTTGTRTGRLNMGTASTATSRHQHYDNTAICRPQRADAGDSPYGEGDTAARNDDACRGSCHEVVCGSRNPAFTSSAAGDLRRSDAVAGATSGRGGGGRGGDEEPRWQQHWRNSPSRALLNDGRHQGFVDSSQFSEELSVDGWSVDSRSMDDRGGVGGGGGGGRRRGRRRWRGNGRFGEFDEEEGDEDDDEDMEGELGEEMEDDEEASMGGFVFDREGDGDGEGNGDTRGQFENAEGLIAVVGGTTDGHGAGGAGEGGAGKWEIGEEEWTKGDSERRPSGSTAPASSYVVDSCPIRNDTITADPSPREGESRAGDICRGNEISSNGESSAACDDIAQDADSGEEQSSGSVSPRHCSEEEGDETREKVDADDEDRHGAAADEDGEKERSMRSNGEINHDHAPDQVDDNDDSCSWNRVSPLALSTAEIAGTNNGYRNHPPQRHLRARSTDAGTTLAAAAAAEASAGNTTTLKVDHLDAAAVRAVLDGTGAAGPVPRNSPGSDSSRRPRGKSWPQNIATGVPADGSDATTTLQGRESRIGDAGEGAQEVPNRAAAALRRDLRRQQGRRWGRGAAGGWADRGGHGRGRRRGGGRGTREVYDLWLYIQMQYCSHNNLQYFLEENPNRRAQTRVDMPQVMHIFMQVAKGLQYVHACGLIHRDLKPANCFLMADGTVKIGDFGLSRHILPADGIDGGGNSAGLGVPAAVAVERLQGGGGDESITGGVGTYLYGSPEQMSGQPYDEKTDMYSLGMLLFEMCHPPFGTKMERTVVLTNAHRLIFPNDDSWGPPKGQEAIKNLCRSMLQRESVARPSAAEIVRQVELMQGKHMLIQVNKRHGVPSNNNGRPDVAVVLRVEALEQEGLLHRVVDQIRALCRGQEGHDARAAGGAEAAAAAEAGAGGARLEQYGLRGHTGSAVMEFLIAGAALEEREAIIAALERMPEVHSVREFPADS